MRAQKVNDNTIIIIMDYKKYIGRGAAKMIGFCSEVFFLLRTVLYKKNCKRGLT